MAASVQIQEFNGAPPGARTNKTSGTVRFKNADDATVDLNNPLVIPPSGQEYSYEKWLRLRIVDAGGFTQIDNIRAYADGSNGMGTGVKVWYGVAGSYRAPAIPDEANDPPRSDVVGSPEEAMSDFFGSSSGSPIDLDGINTGPFTDGSPEEDIGDFLVLVCEVESTASQGVTPSETLTMAWDEI